MRYCSICILFLLCLGVCPDAQSYVYDPPAPNNSPSVGTCNSWPFGVYTGWRFQFIIDGPKIFQNPVVIKDIAFAPCSTGTWTSPQFEFRMSHTTYKDFSTSGTTKFDDILGPTPTVLFNGSKSWTCTSNTWCDFGLTRGFTWDGNRNICGEIRYTGRGSLSASCHRDSTTPRAYTHTGYSSDPYNAVHWYTPIPGEYMMLKCRFTVQQGFMLDADDTVSVGKTATIALKNGKAGEFYLTAASLSQLPLSLGKCTIYLTPDNLFFASVQIGPPVFNKYKGTLDGSGEATASLGLPNIPALAGIIVYHAAVSYGTVFPSECTNTDSTTIVP